MVEQIDELSRRSGRRASNQNSPAAIQAQIEQTRAEMEDTIDQIQHRLSPERLKRETKEKLRDATIGKVESMTHQAEREVRSWRGKVARTVKENPVPMALIGIGLGWLMVTDNEDEYDNYEADPYRRRYPYAAQRDQDEDRDWTGEQAGRAEAQTRQAADSVRERAADVADSVQESTDTAARRAEKRARELGHRVDETTDEARRRARRSVRRGKRTFWQNMNENPLAVGAAAMTVGALVGMALPGTRYEDEWMGERRDRLVDEARVRARETGEQVREVARETKDAAVETAKEEAEKRDLNPATR